MFKEIKDSWGYNLVKTVTGCMADIGGGAIAGAAAAMVPTGKMNPIQKFCLGVGAYGIARWVGKNAGIAFKDNLDETMDVLADYVDPSLQVYAEYNDKMRKEAEQAQSEEDDGPEVA